jgi:hypothetical protein
VSTRRLLVAAGVVVAVIVLALSRTPGTFAFFTDQATTNSGSLTSGSLNAATATAPTQPDAVSKLAINWTAATLTTGGTGTATAKSYDVVEYSALQGGTVLGTVCTGVTTTTCTFAATNAKAYYGVTARFESWTKESNRVTYTDSVGPSVPSTSPDDGSRTYYTTLRSATASDCGANAIACGTAVDSPGPVASVQYTLRRTGALSATACWNGLSWVSTSTCTFAPTTGTTSWSVPGSPNTAYTTRLGFGDWTYVLTLRLTDSTGNTSTSQVTYSTSG